MRKSVTQLKDASPLLSQKLKRPLIKISNCCWQSHLRAMLHCFEDPPHTTTTTTTTTTRLMRSKQYYYHHQQQQRSRMYYSSCAAVSNSSSFTTSTTTSTTSGTIKGNDSLENEQEKKDKSRSLLPYDVSEQQQYLNRLYGSLSIFNLTDHITLSDLEHALRHQQAEKAWQLFCTLTSLNDTTNITIFHTNINNTNNHHQYNNNNNNNNNNNSNINNTYNNRLSHHHSNLLDENDHCIPVPYQHCIDLYGLLLYAQDLASHPNVIAMRQQQLDKIANYIEHQFGESKHDLKASIQRLKIPTYKRLQQALKWRHPKQAWKMYIKLIEEVEEGEGTDGLSKISRSHYLQLISLITMNHRYWNSKKRQHMINKITSTHANIPCQHERSLSAESIEWIGKIYSYYDHQQPKQARKVIRQFLQHVTTPAKDTIDELIWRILPFDMKTARFILDTMHQRHLPQNESVYCHLMHAYMSQHRLYNQALGVFEQMLLIGVTPTLKSFNTLLHLFADQGSTDSAVYIWDTLHGLEIEPDAATYSEMIRCFSQVGQLKSCLHYYQLMLQQQKEKANIVPTLYTYSTLIEAYGKKNDLDGVLQWFQLLLEKGFEPNEVIMTNVLKAIGYHEQQSQQSSLNIMEVIQRIVKQCTMAGIKADTTLYTLLLTLQTSTTTSTTSSSTMATPPTPPTSSSSTSSMIKDINNSYTDNNNNNGKRNHQQNLSFVLQFHRDMLSKCIEPNVYTYTALIGLCGKYGFYDTAQHIFDLMKQSDHQQPNTVTYCALMENWRKANKKEKLESLLYDFILHSKSNAIHGNRLKIDTKLKHQFRCIYGC